MLTPIVTLSPTLVRVNPVDVDQPLRRINKQLRATVVVSSPHRSLHLRSNSSRGTPHLHRLSSIQTTSPSHLAAFPLVLLALVLLSSPLSFPLPHSSLAQPSSAEFTSPEPDSSKIRVRLIFDVGKVPAEYVQSEPVDPSVGENPLLPSFLSPLADEITASLQHAASTDPYRTTSDTTLLTSSVFSRSPFFATPPASSDGKRVTVFFELVDGPDPDTFDALRGYIALRTYNDDGESLQRQQPLLGALADITRLCTQEDGGLELAGSWQRSCGAEPLPPIRGTSFLHACMCGLVTCVSASLILGLGVFHRSRFLTPDPKLVQEMMEARAKQARMTAAAKAEAANKTKAEAATAGAGKQGNAIRNNGTGGHRAAVADGGSSPNLAVFISPIDSLQHSPDAGVPASSAQARSAAEVMEIQQGEHDDDDEDDADTEDEEDDVEEMELESDDGGEIEIERRPSDDISTLTDHHLPPAHRQHPPPHPHHHAWASSTSYGDASSITDTAHSNSHDINAAFSPPHSVRTPLGPSTAQSPSHAHSIAPIARPTATPLTSRHQQTHSQHVYNQPQRTPGTPTGRPPSHPSASASTPQFGSSPPVASPPFMPVPLTHPHVAAIRGQASHSRSASLSRTSTSTPTPAPRPILAIYPPGTPTPQIGIGHVHGRSRVSGVYGKSSAAAAGVGSRAAHAAILAGSSFTPQSLYPSPSALAHAAAAAFCLTPIVSTTEQPNSRRASLVIRVEDEDEGDDDRDDDDGSADDGDAE